MNHNEYTLEFYRPSGNNAPPVLYRTVPLSTIISPPIIDNIKYIVIDVTGSVSNNVNGIADGSGGFALVRTIPGTTTPILIEFLAYNGGLNLPQYGVSTLIGQLETNSQNPTASIQRCPGVATASIAGWIKTTTMNSHTKGTLNRCFVSG
jgi:hypothetical protein